MVHIFIHEFNSWSLHKRFWKWFVFLSAEKSGGECCLRIITTKMNSRDENELWKCFPSRQIKGDRQQFFYLFSPLTSPLSVASPVLHLNHSKSRNRFHPVLVFMKTQVSKSLQWIYIWCKLRSASHSPGNVPLHKLSMEVCPPYFHCAAWLICSLMASCVGHGLGRTSVRVDWACWVCFALLRSSVV